jgi:hypothetical protein
MNLLLGKYSPIPYVLHVQTPTQSRPPDFTGRIKSLFTSKPKPQLTESVEVRRNVDVWMNPSGEDVVMYKLSLKPHLWGETTLTTRIVCGEVGCVRLVCFLAGFDF